MNFIRKLASSFESTNSPRGRTANFFGGTMTTLASSRAVSDGGPLGKDVQWSFDSLDKDNGVTGNSSVIQARGDKRCGVAHSLKRRRDSVHIEDQSSHHKVSKPDSQSSMEIKALSDPPSKDPPKLVVNDATKPAPEFSAGAKNCPFFWDSDSDSNPQEPSLTVPPSVARIDEGLKRRFEQRQAERLTEQQQSEARARSRRLRQEAQERREAKTLRGLSADRIHHGICDFEAEADSIENTTTNDAAASVETSTLDATAETVVNNTFAKQDPMLRVPPASVHSPQTTTSGRLEDQRILDRGSETSRKRLHETPGPTRADRQAEREYQSTREGSAKARKDADDKQAAEWETREEMRRNEERKHHEEAQRARQKCLEDVRKRMEAQSREQTAFAERESALNKLRQASRAGAPKRTPEAERCQEKEPNKIVLEGKPSTSTAAQRCADNLDQQTPLNVPRPPVKTKAELEWAAACEKRIQVKEDRNARAREAELEADKQVKEELDQAERPAPAANNVTSEPLRDRPVSLQSAAGQRALAGLNLPTYCDGRTASLTAKDSQKQPESASRGHDRPLKEISALDAKLFIWKEYDALKWTEVVNLYEQTRGKRLCSDTLRKTFRKVKIAVQGARIDRPLLDLVAAGDAEAIKTVNARVFGANPAQCRQPNPDQQRLRDGAGRSATESHTVFASPACTPKYENESACAFNFDSQAPNNAVLRCPTPPPTEALEGERPQHGGKTINSVRIQQFHENHVIEINKQHEEEITVLQEEVRLLRRGSPVTSRDDYCYFVYQIQRRSFSRDELDDVMSLHDKPWESCGDYDARDEAYFRLEEEALRYRIQFEQQGDDNIDMKSGKSIDDLRSLTIEGQVSGTAEIQVLQFRRSKHDRIPPSTKRGWAPKTVYWVGETVEEKKTEDPLFDEGHWDSSTTKPLYSLVHTSLEDANELAVKRVVELAFVPTTSHLALIAEETKLFEAALLEELQWADGGLFSKCMKSEDGSLKTTVFVEAGTLSGPRNIW